MGLAVIAPVLSFLLVVVGVTLELEACSADIREDVGKCRMGSEKGRKTYYQNE